MSAMAQSMTPMEDALRTKVCFTLQTQLESIMYRELCLNIQQITEALKPTSLEIFNDSNKHAHHKAMQGVTSRETHFR
jgi:stress-induced morphogen